MNVFSVFSSFRAIPIAIKIQGGILGLLGKVLGLCRQLGYKHVLVNSMRYFGVWVASIQSNARLVCFTNSPFETFRIETNEFEQISTVRIAVVIYVSHVDRLEEVCLYLKHIPTKYCLFVIVDKDEDREAVAGQIEGLPFLDKSEIILLEGDSAGDTVLPLAGFSSYGNHFDYVCHVNTGQTLWGGVEPEGLRQYLYAMLLGSDERVNAILTALQRDSSIGLIYPETYSGLPYWIHSWLADKSAAAILSNELGVIFDPDGYVDFPAGSMFWARPHALRPLVDLDPSMSHFHSGLPGGEGALRSALKRFIAISAQIQGYGYLVVRDLSDHVFSHGSHRNLYQYVSPAAQAASTRSVDTADVVSFDLFDTLVIRPFSKPGMLLDYLEAPVKRRFGIGGFSQLRKESEYVCNLRNGFRSDPKLTEIYRVFAELANIPMDIANELMEFEVETEIALLRPRREVVELAERVKAAGKRIILTSDTYSDREFTERILSANGIDFHSGLYVSCEIGKSKHRGDIWEHILERESIPRNRFLHVGDNEHSDIEALEDGGFMHPFHIMKPSVIFRQSALGRILFEIIQPHRGWEHSLLYGLMSNRYSSSRNTDESCELFDNMNVMHNHFEVGYTIIGPIIFNYLTWLIRTSIKDEVKQLKFIARDGFVLNQAYQMICEYCNRHDSNRNLPRGDYFLCSRRAALIPSIRGIKDTGRLLEKFFKGTLREFLTKRIEGIDMAEIELKLGARALDEPVSLPEDHRRLASILARVMDIIVKQSETEREALLQYCEDQKFSKNEKTGLVDLGFVGSIQRSLATILDCPMVGYYFVIHDNAKSIMSDRSIYRGYFGEFVSPLDCSVPVLRYHLLLESILTSPDGQLLYFHKSGDSVIPVFKEPGIAQKEFQTVDLIHKGALHFIKDILNLFGADALDIEFPKDIIERGYELAAIGKLDTGDLKDYLHVEDQYCNNDEIQVLSFYSQLGDKIVS
jgi:FMN phosphatase YigB (HAD superfamily)